MISRVKPHRGKVKSVELLVVAINYALVTNSEAIANLQGMRDFHGFKNKRVEPSLKNKITSLRPLMVLCYMFEVV